MEIVYAPFVLFVAVPVLAFIPAGLLGFCYLRHRRSADFRNGRWVLSAAAVWAVYAVYECGVYVWSQGVVAPIRVDLVVLAPLLTVALFAALVACWRSVRPRNRLQ